MVTPIGIGVLQKGFAELYQSSEHSDCKIICGSYSFDAHKAVLCSQSKYFKTALKSGTFKEGETGVIKLEAVQDGADDSDPCDDPEIVKLMVEYFYLFDYEHGCTRSCGSNVFSPVISPESMLDHAKVFAMAIKYQVSGLRNLAMAKFAEAVKTGWDHNSFARTIFTVYNSTPDDIRDLRDIVADSIHEHFDVLKAKDEIEIIVSSIGGLAYDLLKRSGTDYRCSKGHIGEEFRQSCVCHTRSCGCVFDICKACYPSRYSAYCPFCGDTLKIR